MDTIITTLTTLVRVLWASMDEAERRGASYYDVTLRETVGFALARVIRSDLNRAVAGLAREGVQAYELGVSGPTSVPVWDDGRYVNARPVPSTLHAYARECWGEVEPTAFTTRLFAGLWAEAAQLASEERETAAIWAELATL